MKPKHTTFSLVMLAIAGCPLSSLAENYNVVINGGEVHFFGGVVNAACVVDTNSEAQTVEMGQIRTNAFSGPGTWGDPQAFTLVLKDCDTSVSQQVGVAFEGLTDQKDPEVIAVTAGAGSAQGIGIGIFDSLGNLVIPNTQPQTFSAIQNNTTVLNFVAKYRAIAKDVLPGEADAQAWFTLTYM
ncbi:fimbrial protein [Salmonella enterica subsp. salamae]|nr:fimbrial protein [Salmonella enterica subsp. salamae]ECJ2280731.1 fimbrial protein [Salmonella enterica subsp. salamae]HCC0886628.1 fimbrial protein [Salmonella enterica]